MLQQMYTDTQATVEGIGTHMIGLNVQQNNLGGRVLQSNARWFSKGATLQRGPPYQKGCRPWMPSQGVLNDKAVKPALCAL